MYEQVCKVHERIYMVRSTEIDLRSRDKKGVMTIIDVCVSHTKSVDEFSNSNQLSIFFLSN